MTETNMNNNQTPDYNESLNEKHYETLLQSAGRMLGLTSPGIAQTFSDHTLYVYQCHEKGIIDDHIEVWFDEEEASIVCNFNKEKKCEVALIFLEEDEQIPLFTRYLNSTYMYNHEKKHWKTPYGIVLILPEKKRFFFGCYPN